jgi:internalin A
MLQYQENNETYNIARIQSDPEDKKIFIAISGRKETRRQFLSIIRDAFKKIHNTFANLEISEWVPVPNHPEYPPLSYQDLLGLEAMDVKEYPIGKLKVNINIRQLLDGYESMGYRRAYEDMRDIAKIMADRSVTIENHPISQATINTNYLQGSNIANFAKEVVENTHLQDNQHIHQSPSQNLTQAAKDIRDLLDQLNQDYDRNTPTGQAMIGAKAIEAIEQNPTLKDRLINALKAGSGAALEELVNHPVIKIVVTVFKGFEDL